MAAAVRDWSLRSGERQPSPHFADANASHRARYAWAAGILGDRRGQRGADIFCGTGYGTSYLAERTGATMRGFDGSSDAVTVAAAAHPGIVFTPTTFPGPLPVSAADFVACVESLEHVAEDAAFLAALHAMLVPGGDLLLTVPNEERLPCAAFRNPFHVRHYTRAALDTLVTAAGFTVVARHGQRIHRVMGGVRRGRVPDAHQSVRAEAPGFVPCTLCWHLRSMA